MENEVRGAAGHSLLAALRGRRGVLAGEVRLGRQHQFPSPLHLLYKDLQPSNLLTRVRFVTHAFSLNHC